MKELISKLLSTFPEESSACIRCSIICGFMLYPAFFSFLPSFGSYPLYTQVLLAIGASTIYTTIAMPLSFAIFRDEKGKHLPPIILGVLISFTFCFTN